MEFIFNSLKRALGTKNIPENQQAEILLNILGYKADNQLIYTSMEELESDKQLTEIDLNEQETTPKACL